MKLTSKNVGIQEGIPEIIKMRNVICLEETYIAGLSKEYRARPHRHPLTEIYISCSGISSAQVNSEIVQGQIIVIGPEVLHTVKDVEKRGLLLLSDPLSEKGFSLKENVLGKREYRVFSQPDAAGYVSSLSDDASEKEVASAAGNVIRILQGAQAVRPFRDSVLEAIKQISEEEEDFTMESLAGKVHLSKSRLAHLFSEETGITLKSYLQYKRMEKAFRRMTEGQNITDAAPDTGFSGSSHIAVSSSKLTGMQLHKILGIQRKDSDFLKAARREKG